MNLLDIIILICFIPALIQGIRKGFIAQAISIISLIMGIWLSCRFAKIASEWLAQYIEASSQILNAVSFALIFFLVILGLTAIGKLLEATVKIIMLGWLNRLLGAVFALLKCVLIVGICIMAFSSLNAAFEFVSEESLAESVLYMPLRDTAYNVFPYLKEMLF